jgi:beta-glucosidase
VIEFYDHPRSVDRSKSGDFSAYNPQWDFGFGLSYNNAQIGKAKFENKNEKDGSFTISVTVNNPNQKVVKTLVPVYLSDLYASTSPEGKRLIGFNKTTLNPGENKTLYFKFDANSLKRVAIDGKWRAEKGTFEISCGEEKLIFELENDINFD